MVVRRLTARVAVDLVMSDVVVVVVAVTVVTGFEHIAAQVRFISHNVHWHVLHISALKELFSNYFEVLKRP